MSVRRQQRFVLLPGRASAPCGAAGTLHGPAVDVKPQFMNPRAVAPTATHASSPMSVADMERMIAQLNMQNAQLSEEPYDQSMMYIRANQQRIAELRALIAQHSPSVGDLLKAHAKYLGPFKDAFTYEEYPVTAWGGKVKQRTKGLVSYDGSRVVDVSGIQKWVKIGGKNGMGTMDMAQLSSGAFYKDVMDVVQGMYPGKTVGYVFDGDNYEPDETPFTLILAALIRAGHTVVAVKDKYDFSDGFVDDWMPFAQMVPNNFHFAYVGIGKEALSVAADAFVFYGTTYISPSKDYRFRYNKEKQITTDPTQGYGEVLALMERKNEFQMIHDGTYENRQEGHPIVAVRKRD